MNLLLVSASEIDAEGGLTLEGDRARHLTSVLKVTIGQRVRLGVIDGPLGAGVVVQVKEGTVALRCALEPESPAPSRIDLLLALPRPKVLRRLYAQLAALGVGRIILTNAARVERHYFDTHVLTPECYRPLLIEGLQQARDTRVPAVSIHRRFRVLVEDELEALAPGALRLVAHPGAPASIASVVANGVGSRVLLALGPEGGWTDFELDLLASRGFAAVGSGSRTLRSDTAAIALLAILHESLRGAER
jgi:RsmE family RNA methyltransferase